MITNIIELYKSLQESIANGSESRLEQLILDCFEYNIFYLKPTKKHIKWFEECYECKYPIDISELTKSLQKDLKQTIKYRKEDKKFEETKARERAKNGFAKSDCWDIRDWFLDLMPKMLTEMKDNLHGFPDAPVYTGVDTQPLCLEDKDKENPKFIEWKEKLEKMIFLLNEMNEDTCSYKNQYEEPYITMYRDSCREKFFNMFSENFWDLWD